MGDLPDFTQAVAGISLQQITNSFVNPSIAIDVSSWNSVIVRIGSLHGSAVLALQYQFFTADGLTLIDAGVLACGTPGSNPAWTLPVNGPLLKIVNSTPDNAMVAQVFGSNVQSRKRMLYDWLPSRDLACTVPNATPAGTFTLFQDVSTDPIVQNATSCNGTVTLFWNVGNMGGATTVRLYVEKLLLNGTAVTELLASISAPANTQILIGHPYAFTRWFQWNNILTTSSASPTLTVFPNDAP